MSISLYINDIKVTVEPNSTVLQACNYLELEVPKFCFHNDLEIAGNCRMCLVEVKNSIKPVASCALPVSEGLCVYTNTPLVKKAREAVLEFLLLNHPLDCPICDQGGECDLQDQTLIYGSDKSRFFELKRGVEDKNCGPFIKTIMTRCIHCTRCVRFAQEICGIDNLGTTGRGNTTEIGFYIQKMFASEFSGNVIDLCPVGALTNKPFAFKARSWELKNRNSIDILDSLCANIKVNVFNNEIIRILPLQNRQINEEWITNKTRFFFDSLKYQRLTTPMKKTENGEFLPMSWFEVFEVLTTKIADTDPSNIAVHCGNTIDLSSFLSLKKLLNNLGINNIKKGDLNFTNKIYYQPCLNKGFNDLNKSDNCVLIGYNSREDIPLINLHLRRRQQKNNLKVYNIGEKLNLTYPSINLGNSNESLISLIEGKNNFCKQILKSKQTDFLVSQNFLNDPKNQKLLNFFKKNFSNNKVNIHIVNSDISSINFIETGFENKQINVKNDDKKKLTYLYNTYNFLNKFDKLHINFKVYQGHHFTPDAQNSELLIPSKVFLEKNSIFINLLNDVNVINKSIESKHLNKSDDLFFKNLNIFIKKKYINNYNFTKRSILQIMPYLKTEKIKIPFNLLPDNVLFFNSDSKNIKPFVYNTNVLEKYSKILTNANNIIKINKNFL